MSRPGIKEIARRANVSPATVSRVFSSPELVSRKTLQKVKKVIEEAGYRPNRMGASLRTRRSGNIVAIIPDITKPVNAEIIRAIESQAQLCGYSVLLGDTQGLEAREKHYADLVSNGQADGILLFCPRLPFDLPDSQNPDEQLPPLVNANELVDSQQIVQICVDNLGAAKAATEHLINLGHRRIAVVKGPDDTPSSNERMRGYQLALEEAGIEFDPSLVEGGDYSLDSGKQAARSLLQKRHRPSAIFCLADDMAIGVMNVLQQQGFAVPQDISVMGFDDIRYAEYVTPALTTVHQPLEQIGTLSVNLLSQLLAGQAPQQRFTRLPFTLSIRQSTGPLSGAE